MILARVLRISFNYQTRKINDFGTYEGVPSCKMSPWVPMCHSATYVALLDYALPEQAKNGKVLSHTAKNVYVRMYLSI
jgi:hypothetical protein